MRQRDRQTDTQTDTQIDRQTVRQDRQVGLEGDKTRQNPNNLLCCERVQNTHTHTLL